MRLGLEMAVDYVMGVSEMMSNAHYVIRARPALVELVEREGLSAEFPTDPFHWSHREGGRSAITHRHHALWIKRLWLAYVRCVIVRETPLSRLKLLDGLDPFSAWWTLDDLGAEDDNTDDVLAEIRALDPAAAAALNDSLGED